MRGLMILNVYGVSSSSARNSIQMDECAKRASVVCERRMDIALNVTTEAAPVV